MVQQNNPGPPTQSLLPSDRLMPLSIAGYSHTGLKRSQNQDAFLLLPELQTFIVADGMGGHKGGETASLMTVTSICDYLKEYWQKNAATDSPQAHAKALESAIQFACRSVFETAQNKPELNGMGTTCTVIQISGHRATIAQVGDSRCYLYSHHTLWQITQDHSLVQEKLKAGLIKREELKSDKMKNVITRSVGFESTVKVDLYQMDVSAEDVFLLCSDGLSGMCEDAQLLQLLEANLKHRRGLNLNNGNLQKATQSLCQAANANGGDDNVTAVLVAVGAD